VNVARRKTEWNLLNSLLGWTVVRGTFRPASIQIVRFFLLPLVLDQLPSNADGRSLIIEVNITQSMFRCHIGLPTS
jgi:hypothetical protein